MSVAQRERAALVETLRAVGPDAPTLCEGWTTRDLTAHLVVRERRPDALPGLLFGPLTSYTARVQNRLATSTKWEDLVELVASGSAGAVPVQGSRSGSEHPRDVCPP